MAVRHRDSDYFKASQVPMHAQPSSDPVKRWRRSKRRPRFRRPPKTGHLWVDALVSVTFPRADVAPVGYWPRWQERQQTADLVLPDQARGAAALLSLFVGVPEEMLRSIGLIVVLSSQLDHIRMQILEEADQVPVTTSADWPRRRFSVGRTTPDRSRSLTVSRVGACVILRRCRRADWIRPSLVGGPA